MRSTPAQLEWSGCYDDSWDGFIVPEAFAHPAKFARGLITRIYVHMLAEGMIQPGGTIVDPFGGIASGGIVAAGWGLRWLGCELEQKFVDLGQRNIALHRALWESFKDPVPVLVQGDSRKLRENLRGVLAEAVVCSPPFCEAQSGGGLAHPEARYKDGTRIGTNCGYQNQAFSGGNLAGLPSGSIDSVVSSPPYASGTVHDGNGIDQSKLTGNKPGPNTSAKAEGYGSSDGQLSRLPSGSVDSVVSSPPYAETPVPQIKGRIVPRGTANERSAAHVMNAKSQESYGTSPGQLSALPVGQVDACVSSPPYEGTILAGGGGIANEYRNTYREGQNYGDQSGQVGAMVGETFWSAARDIVAECYAILKPGGYSAWVCKDFVRNKARVPFCDDWCRLLESQGFVVTTRVHAMLVKETSHPDLFGGADHVERTERKSFFRRLAEKKGSPRIDWEEVIFARRPA